MDRRPALDQPDGGDVRLVRRGQHYLRCGLDPAPSLRAFFAQAGASGIYDDVVYEGQSIEMERLWLWVARNIPGLSRSHRETAMQRSGISGAEVNKSAASAAAR